MPIPDDISDGELREMIAKRLGKATLPADIWGPGWNPLSSAEDLREVVRWGWEEHAVRVWSQPGWTDDGEPVVEGYYLKKLIRYRGAKEPHDGTRASIDRAEGRAVCLAMLRALEGKEGGA